MRMIASIAAALSVSFAVFGEVDAIVVTTREGLEAIAGDLGGSYALGADIDICGAAWTPLGGDSEPFTGTFRGNGHAIRNLVCTNNPAENGTTMDCCALMECTATDNGDACAGGFAGYVARGCSIATSWCSGCVDSEGRYVGAFVGKANGTGIVTVSYYDTSANGQMKAAGTSSPRGSDAYAGITSIDLDGKYHAASYPSFDFTNTWSIAEGVDEPRLVPLTGFIGFLDDCCLPLGTDPLFATNGIPLTMRYMYGIWPAAERSDRNGNPFMSIRFGADGSPYIEFPPVRNMPEFAVKFTAEASPTLSPWNPVGEYSVMLNDCASCSFDFDSVPDSMFFRWRLSIED